MTKPTAPRKADVLSKLEYANHRVQELLNTLYLANSTASDPAHLVHTCADIISSVRECFDYLGQDIISAYVVPNTTNAKTSTAFSNGTLKAYFPYFSTQIKRPDSIFAELLQHTPALHQDLLDFTDNIASNATMPNTLFTFQLLDDVRVMVNEKKHDKLLAVVPNADAAYLIEGEGVTITLPHRDQQGWSSFAVEPGSTVKSVSEYRFAHNDKEVGKFCMYATRATECVINQFYSDHFT
ncbi:hypothetical protein AB7M18_002100 [Pseudomonas viridiflava]